MDRVPLPITLEDEHTRTFMIRWIIFNDDRIHNSSENILDENVIVRQLVVTVV